MALVTILQSTLNKVIGRQFNKSNKEPSSFGTMYKSNDASSLGDGKLICFKSLIEAFDKVMSSQFKEKFITFYRKTVLTWRLIILKGF